MDFILVLAVSLRMPCQAEDSPPPPHSYSKFIESKEGDGYLEGNHNCEAFYRTYLEILLLLSPCSFKLNGTSIIKLYFLIIR